ncbi:hypothetical protein LUZ63_010528 [Rhynchospora breviuscula]|uniref:Uncharacterized protein n=1 Tax=Rhynchospora breviuscula TaxID=2022672 RepID=A0A9Q0CHE5_9POAL|nr:hypothetical protein LUZ63_010528 [Rhynchospora breviuscula]
MAQLASLLRPNNRPFLQKALLFMFVALILPLFPSQAPEFVTNQTIVNKFWELIHLLFIGIVISYGLFSRRNTEMIPSKELEFEPNSPNSYVSQILPGLDDKEEEEEEEGKVQQIWNNQVDMSKPATVVDKPLFLPVRSLNLQSEESNTVENSTVLPSPIPWRSRSGRIETKDEFIAPKIKSVNLSSLRSKRLSPSPSLSLSRETTEKKKTLYKENASRPPAPPPPPPPFLGHGYQPPLSDRKAKSTMRSFKDELKDVSMRSNKPRTRISFDRTSSSSPSLVAKSVRTIRSKEAPIESRKKAVMEPRDDDTVERVSMSSDSDEVSDSTYSELEDEEEIEGYSDKEMIEKPKFDTEKLEGKKRVHEEEVNEVDKKADEFIAKFREQIRLQRIESIKRSAGERAIRSHKKVPRN